MSTFSSSLYFPQQPGWIHLYFVLTLCFPSPPNHAQCIRVSIKSLYRGCLQLNYLNYFLPKTACSLKYKGR